jgi:chromate transporter
VNEKTNKPKVAHLLLILFRTTFTLSAFTFGGGYVIVPLMRKSFVDTLKWIDQQEMLDLIAIAQSAPGPIAVNTSILVGYKVFGIGGALVSLLGTVLPPLITLTLLSYIYEAIKNNLIVQTLFYGMSIGVAIVILDAVFTLAKTVASEKKVLPLLIMAGAFVATYLLKFNIVLIILSCAVVGIIATLAVKDKENP